MSELRWNPLLGEWTITATHRQERTFLPPANYCPLCPTQPGAFETEIPAPAFDIVVFENRFPSLQAVPPPPAIEGSALYPVRPAQGICEVVVYTDRHTTTLAEESVERIRRLILVWCDRFAELGAREEVAYVYIFENKGEAIGVTLHHPHGQIYAYPFIPPRVARQLAQSRQHWARTGRDLLGDILAAEQADGRRIVCENEAFVVLVPFLRVTRMKRCSCPNGPLQPLWISMRTSATNWPNSSRPCSLAMTGSLGFPCRTSWHSTSGRPTGRITLTSASTSSFCRHTGRRPNSSIWPGVKAAPGPSSTTPSLKKPRHGCAPAAWSGKRRPFIWAEQPGGHAAEWLPCG